MKKIFILLIVIIISILACSYERGKAQNNEESQKRIPAEAIHKLESEEDLDTLLDDIGDARIVLLGESSHGTSEFYKWRAAISKKLIQEKDFQIIAVEADWADAFPVNRYIKENKGNSVESVLGNFDRWPQWMWKNEEIADLAKWLNTWNKQHTTELQVGFYGLDVYGIWESLEIVYTELQKLDPNAAVKAQAVIDCFGPYQQDEQRYANATLNGKSCSKVIQELLSEVKALADAAPENEETLNLLQNTLVVVNAENYYRTAIKNYPASWNIRDRHMSLTINNLLNHYGPDSRIIVWEHNTHIGDARATDMADDGMVNVGQLERERHGEEDVYIVGFGTNSGKVLAAPAWGSEVSRMTIPPGRRDSWEWILHREGPTDKIIFTDALKDLEFYKKRMGHRAIGVVYNPSAEAGNYVPTVIPQRYDAFIYFDKTTPLNPLP